MNWTNPVEESGVQIMGDCSRQRDPQSIRPYAALWLCEHEVPQSHLWGPRGEIVGQSRPNSG